MSIFQSSILSEASSFGDAVALLDRVSGQSVRYSELAAFLSARLGSLQFNRSKPVATWASAGFSHATFLLALLAENGVVAPLSPHLPNPEALKRASWIGADLLWTAQGVTRLNPVRPLFHVRSEGTLLFTSGSSGSPSAVWHNLESHISNAQAAAGRILLGPGCGWLLSLPLHHVSGFSILIRCLLAGATVVFPETNAPLKRQVEDPAVTHLSVVGVQLRRLLTQGASFRHLQAVLAGGGPIDAKLVSDSIKAGVPLRLTYGMTETASQIATSGRLVAEPLHIHSGRPLPGREVRISADGEIQVRGPILPQAIFTEKGRRQATCSDGWFATGDVGGFDGEGNLIITGRRNRMFISGGENICPEVIENLLASCDGVRRAVVVGVPHVEFGMRPVAFVAGPASVECMVDFLRSRLERFCVPDVFFPWPRAVGDQDAKVNYEIFSRLAVEAMD
ncbi:MAG: AMP-binding protein [bacterium]